MGLNRPHRNGPTGTDMKSFRADTDLLIFLYLCMYVCFMLTVLNTLCIRNRPVDVFEGIYLNKCHKLNLLEVCETYPGRLH